MLEVHPWHLRQTARVLHNGGVIAYPTEGVYGLGCDPLDANAVSTILCLKNRRMSAGLVLIAAAVEQLAPYMGPLDRERQRQLLASWPGPVTWVVPAATAVPYWIRGAHTTVAVRVTAHPLARAVCDYFGGAVVSTSANPTGRPPARDALTVTRLFGDKIDYVLHGQVGKLGGPTEIRDARTGARLRGP